MTSIDLKKGEIILYQTPQKEVELRVRFHNESVWLSQSEIAVLFGSDRSVITKHIGKIFSDKEVDKKRNVQKMHIPNSDKPVDLYSLDVILAVGYRTNSSRAIHFRIWATKILKQYLIRGFVINEKRLLEAQRKLNDLQQAVLFVQRQSQKTVLKGQEAEILQILAEYAKTFTLLEKYDKGTLGKFRGSKSKYILEYVDCLKIIANLKKALISKREAGDLFAQERGNILKGVIGSIYQTFDGKELYPTIEQKSAQLLYFIVKDHPFSDGNKRVAAALFVYFLDQAGQLFKKSGERNINDTALTALVLLVAESDPKDKDVMIKIIINLLSES